MIVRRRTRVQLPVLLIVGACAACGAESSEHIGPTFEGFVATTRPSVLADGTTRYELEGDLLLVADQLRGYYDYLYPGESPELDGDRGKRSQPLIARANAWGQPFIWSGHRRHSLTYCISHRFDGWRVRYGKLSRVLNVKRQIYEATRAAASEWETAAGQGVSFHFAGYCDGKPNNVLFRVVPATTSARYHAYAFFPDSAPVSNQRDIRVYPRTFAPKCQPGQRSDENCSLFPLPGLMRHELGHVLGFLHEHIRGRPPGPAYCRPYSQPGYRVLSSDVRSRDRYSVMHYAECGGKGPYDGASDANQYDFDGDGRLDRGHPLNNLTLSAVDRLGARNAYSPKGAFLRVRVPR